MRVLLDECTDYPLKAALETLGFDTERSTPGISDDDVLKEANSTDRVLITMDYGFGERVIRKYESSVGVVLISGKAIDRRDPDRFAKLAARIHALQNSLRGHLAVIDKKRIRSRPLPIQKKRDE
jgi:predicted nuclease of predicted toxin-antitoxin system